MTPKLKAKELVEGFADLLQYEMPAKRHEEQFKECALRVVNEIIGTLNKDIRDLDVRGNVLLDLIKYWRTVKSEIQSL